MIDWKDEGLPNQRSPEHRRRRDTAKTSLMAMWIGWDVGIYNLEDGYALKRDLWPESIFCEESIGRE
jgi:hypothetical protein